MSPVNNAMSMTNVAPRSMFEERPLRPPTIGKIRPGIKVLKAAVRQNVQAAKLYNDMVASGESFDTIDSVIERQCQIKNALVPKNVDYFTCRRSDFTNPDIATEILRLYGEDRGEGLRLYKFPVVFAFNDWLENAPHQLTTWGQSGRKYFSAYEGGVRYCKTYPKVERDERAKRAVKNFGMRIEVHRQDAAIEDGVCSTNTCPEFQSGQCKLNASLLFAIPEIKGLGLIELVTTSMYGIGKAREAMEMFAHANGRLSGNVLWINKKQIDISRQKDGEYVRSLQWIPMVNAELDMSAKLSLASDDRVPALRDARGDNVVDMAEAKSRATDDAGYGEPQGSFVVLSDTPASETLLPDPPAASCEGNASKQATAGPVDAIKESVVDPDGGASDFTEQGVGASDPSLADETVEEKRGRLAWLLKDLAISEHEDLKTTFRKYVWAKYGRGWDERAKDLDKINDRLLLAMNDFQAFADEMDETIARFSDQRA